MADELDLSEIMRRTVQANAKLYKGWVDLSLDYFRAVADIFGGVPEAAASPAETLVEDNAGAVVLEGDEGETADAAFMVTNDLGRKLTCTLVASPFRDADGNVVKTKLSFDPARFELTPGQQGIVHVQAAIDGKLIEGVAYSGEISIEGMEGFAVPAVIRRRHAVEMSPIDRVVDGHKPAASAKKTARKSASKTARKSASKSSRKSAGKTARKATRKSGRKKPTSPS